MVTKTAGKDVLAARERALEGMSPEQIERLSEVIIAANLRLESGYLYDDMFGKLEDPGFSFCTDASNSSIRVMKSSAA